MNWHDSNLNSQRKKLNEHVTRDSELHFIIILIQSFIIIGYFIYACSPCNERARPKIYLVRNTP